MEVGLPEEQEVGEEEKGAVQLLWRVEKGNRQLSEEGGVCVCVAPDSRYTVDSNIKGT